MMWRLIDPKHPLYDAALAAQFGDSIERVYKRADEFVGEVVKRVGPGVPVMIVSDHGFHSWRKAVNLNTWLVQNGYMALKGQQAGRQEAVGSLRRRHVLGKRRLESRPAPTRWASARSTSTSAAASRRGSSARAPRRSRSPTR